MSTYDVRIWGIREHQSRTNGSAKPRSSYRVRWGVNGREFGETFQTRAMAESFRSKLMVAQREGVAFDETSGLPEPMAREQNRRSWHDLAVAFVDLKWPRASAKQRKSIAEALATVTPALLATDRGRPADRDLRAALYGWVFNKTRRDAGPPPEHLAAAVAWVQANTVNLAVLDEDSGLVRKALDQLATLTDGRPAAANTVARKRAVFYGALQYAAELRLLDRNPIEYVSWKTPKGNEGIVDRNVVVNHRQAQELLAAVRALMPELDAFFGCMYYAALRPEEVLHLRVDEYERSADPEAWGWLHLSGATVTTGSGWSDSADTTEDRGLKHRAKATIRPVPVAPQLRVLLDTHLAEFEPGPGGRMFVTRRGPGGRRLPGPARPVPDGTYTEIWRRARATALTPRQQRSPLAGRPYDLRHAAVSTWLNAGVPAPQVAEWAGHSVHVLLKVYAKCIDGQVEVALQKIAAALAEDAS